MERGKERGMERESICKYRTPINTLQFALMEGLLD